MKRKILRALPLLLLSLAATGQATPIHKPTEAAAAVDIADRAASQRGGRARVAVLGTAHLASAPEGLAKPAVFDPLVARLAAFKPDLVAVESLTGAQCDYLRTYKFAYEGTAEQYCPNPTAARAQLKLDGAAAERELEAMLGANSTTMTPAQRRRAAALFLAIGEPASAGVQWLRLPAAERVADEVLTAELVAQIEKTLARRSEDTLIAIPLAVRLGLDRVYPVDDHTGDRASGPIDEAAWAADMTRIWKNTSADSRQKLDAQALNRAVATGDVLAWYQWLNSPQAARLAVGGDFGAAAGDAGAQRSGRAYLAYWETRNLRMAANIREAVGRTHADRAVAIVGAAHKAYYERYLGVTSDIELVGVDGLLKPEAAVDARRK